MVFLSHKTPHKKRPDDGITTTSEKDATSTEVRGGPGEKIRQETLVSFAVVAPKVFLCAARRPGALLVTTQSHSSHQLVKPAVKAFST